MSEKYSYSADPNQADQMDKPFTTDVRDDYFRPREEQPQEPEQGTQGDGVTNDTDQTKNTTDDPTLLLDQTDGKNHDMQLEMENIEKSRALDFR